MLFLLCFTTQIWVVKKKVCGGGVGVRVGVYNTLPYSRVYDLVGSTVKDDELLRLILHM